jgi:hypothetical protein
VAASAAHRDSLDRQRHDRPLDRLRQHARRGNDVHLGSAWSGNGNLISSPNAALGPLQDNGGPTPTMLPGPGSAASTRSRRRTARRPSTSAASHAPGHRLRHRRGGSVRRPHLRERFRRRRRPARATLTARLVDARMIRVAAFSRVSGQAIRNRDMKPVLFRCAGLLATLLACTQASATTGVDTTTAAWRDAKRARIENTWRDGHPATTIVPAVPNGATFTFIYPTDPTDGFASTATPAAAAGCAGGRSATAASTRWPPSPRIGAACCNRTWTSSPVCRCRKSPPIAATVRRTTARAAPHYALSNVANAPHANALYPAALANALAGFDLQPDYEHHHHPQRRRRPRLRSAVERLVVWHRCGHAPPSSRIPMFVVMLHEFGHGLGFGRSTTSPPGHRPAADSPSGAGICDVSAGKHGRT